MYDISFTKEALKGAAFLKKTSPAAYRKLNALIEELKVHPCTGTGKPEILKYIPGGMWSRRIDKKNRLMYLVHEDVVEVLVVSVTTHYGDK